MIQVTYRCFILWGKIKKKKKLPSPQPWLQSGLFKNVLIIIHIQGENAFECRQESLFPVMMG